MKYAIIIPDGAADEPLKELGNQTPFEAAETPKMDRIAMTGRQGLARTVPDGFESGSDVATMCLLGYDPAVYHTGRAPLEAAAQQIPLSSTDWVFRCNLVTVIDNVMKDHSAGGISDAEAQRLLSDLARHLHLSGFEFYNGVSYRNLLVYRGSDEFDVQTKPPHEIPEERIEKYVPRGKGSEILNHIMDESRDLFEHHEINEVRRQTGLNPATQVWLWGQGHAPNMPKFKDRFGVTSAAMITGVDLLRGLAVLLGWDVLNVEGMTSFHDTNYRGQGEATAAALDKYDLVFSHIEAPDEASHQADWKTKVAAIEHIDKYVVGPVLDKLQSFKEWRIMVLPDHPTNIATRKHGYAPTPFCMAGTRVQSAVHAPYSEKNAAASDLKIERGHELMEYFLRRGKSVNFSGEYQLTFEEYVEYCRYIQMTRRDRAAENKRLAGGIVGAAFALGFAVLIYYLTHSGNHPIPIEDIPFPLWFAIVLMICVVSFPWRRWNRQGALRKAWEKSSTLHHKWKIHVDETGLALVQHTAEFRMGWDYFIAFEESRALFLLFQNANSAYPIPKRIFKDTDEVNACRAFMKRTISAPTGEFPVIPVSKPDSGGDAHEIH